MRACGVRTAALALGAGVWFEAEGGDESGLASSQDSAGAAAHAAVYAGAACTCAEEQKGGPGSCHFQNLVSITLVAGRPLQKHEGQEKAWQLSFSEPGFQPLKPLEARI